LRIEIPRVTIEETKIQNADQVLTQATSNLAIGAASIVPAILSGALHKIWNMINGLQIFVHLPLLGIDFPDNAMYVVTHLITVATFSILDTDSIYAAVTHVP
jgi:hypothetical protein